MAAFPSTGILTLFPPPAENPLYESGRWAQLNLDRPPMQKIATGPTTGAATDSEHGNPNYSYWAQETFSTDSGPVEVWACTAGGQLGAALETWRVFLAITLGDRWSGYLAYYGGGIGKGFAIRRYDDGNAGFFGIAGSGGGYPDKLGLRINGGEVECWAEFGGVWAMQCSASDGAYRGNFYLGIGIEDPTAGGLSFPCFGGGKPHRTQIYRILPAIADAV